MVLGLEWMLNSREDFLKLFYEGILASENDTLESFNDRVQTLKKLPTHHFKNPIFGIKKVHAHVNSKNRYSPGLQH